MDSEGFISLLGLFFLLFSRNLIFVENINDHYTKWDKQDKWMDKEVKPIEFNQGEW